MSAREPDTPSPADLQAYSLGKLDPRRTAEIETYLAEHPECLNILDDTPDDDVVQHLRGAGELPTIASGRAEDATPLPEHSVYWLGSQTEAHIPASKSRPAIDPGTVLADHPRYRLIRPLGEGGMGTVFLAEHRLMRRPVALKLIRPECLNDRHAVQRFRREMQAAARLSHRNIVTAHDAEEVAGTHFLVMELIEGASLNDWLAAHGPLSPAEAGRYLVQACVGLQYAHEKGMVHRDLKPHNLMRTPDGTIKILDFGLARLMRTADRGNPTQLTATGAMLGTADYMAPEQAQDSSTADIRADIYSLGCTLYHLLAGQVPFPSGTSVDKFIRHSVEQPPALGTLRSDVPAGLVAVVEKMMAKEPTQRYQTPAEVAAALEPFTREDVPPPAPAAPEPQPYRLFVGALFVALGILLIAALALVISFSGD